MLARLGKVAKIQAVFLASFLIWSVAASAVLARADELSDTARLLKNAGFPDVARLELRECEWMRPPYGISNEGFRRAKNVFLVNPKTQRVVGWHGVGFSVLRVGKSASIEPEIEALMPLKFTTRNPNQWRARAPTLGINPLTIVILELRGEKLTARRLWEKWRTSEPDNTNERFKTNAVGYWLSALRRAGIAAFTAPQADFSNARLNFGLIANAREPFRLPLARSFGSKNLSISAPFDEAQLVLADIARRQKPTSPPGQEIARWIWKLQDVRVIFRRDEREGSRFHGHPVFEQLVARGNAAIPALLGCLENDRRLSRTFDPAYGGYRASKVVPVADIAKEVLGAILGRRFTDESPAQIRAFAKKSRATMLKNH